MGDPGPTINGAHARNWVPVLEQPFFSPQKVPVVCIGAGIAGLIMAHKHKHENASEFIDLTIYEKNAGIRSRSSQIQTGAPSTLVVLRSYSTYRRRLRSTALTNTSSSIRRPSQRSGTTQQANGTSRFHKTAREDTADVLINAAGILNTWRWPSIKGLDSFKGTLLHRADWDPSTDCAGMRVALIGNGSSGIQMLPQIQPKAAHLTTYIRHPTWISPPYDSEFTPKGTSFAYSEEQKEEFRADPEKLFKYRHEIEAALNGFFGAIMKDSPMQAWMRQMFVAQMRERLENDDTLCEKLIPEWHVSCRRLTPGDGYLEALREKNVKIESGSIEEITPTGIKMDGMAEEFDIIVCATGFDINFCPAWEMIGKDGSRLADQWRESPEAYFGICAPNVPNHFICNGPNYPIGHGTLLAVMDWTANWIVRWCRKIATEDLKAVRVSDSACDDYNIYSQEFLKRTAWASGCKSWYKNGKADGPGELPSRRLCV